MANAANHSCIPQNQSKYGVANAISREVHLLMKHFVQEFSTKKEFSMNI